jgi:hypothetical protein
MRPAAVVVAEVLPKDPAQVSLIEHDDVIQTLPAYGTDYAFDKGICQGERGAVSPSLIPKRLTGRCTASP